MKQQYSVNNNFKMKKSPLSTPSGSKGKKSYNWKSHEHKNRTGYSYVKSDSYQCTSPNGGQRQSGNDFIPLNISTPMPEQNRRHSSNWHGSGGRNHRNSGSGGFNHYRNNYHASPKSNFNNLYSPYKLLSKQFYNHKKVSIINIYINIWLLMQENTEYHFILYRDTKRIRVNRLTYHAI